MDEGLPGLENWVVDITEASAGIYTLNAKHQLGAGFECTGTNPDEVLIRLRVYAASLEQGIERTT